MGGCGGGGNHGQAGQVYTGGGGGSFAAGGAGIVVVSYPGPQRADGGTVSCVGGNVIHTFTSSGNLCVREFFITN